MHEGIYIPRLLYEYFRKIKKMKRNINRDENIIASINRNINLNTQIVKSKKIYSRKRKHKHLGY